MRKTDPRSLKDAVLGDLKVMGIESMNAFRDGFIMGMNGLTYQTGLWYNIQTPLEKEAIAQRAIQTSQNLYKRDPNAKPQDENSTEYNLLHPNAISNGDCRGKGSVYEKGHESEKIGIIEDPLPNRKETPDKRTSPYDATEVGNNCDITRRNVSTTKSLYNEKRPYYMDNNGAQVVSQKKLMATKPLQIGNRIIGQ